MCGGVKRHVTQSWLERAQRAMHGVRSTAHEARRREELREEQRRVAWLDKHLNTKRSGL